MRLAEGSGQSISPFSSWMALHLTAMKADMRRKPLPILGDKWRMFRMMDLRQHNQL
jgi:hypothetical protein